MRSVNIFDVQRLCKSGTLEAYTEGERIYLKDKDTGKRACLKGEPAQDLVKVVIYPDPESNQGPYKGFLTIKCEGCGKVRAYCARLESYSYTCDACGHETPLENLRPMHMVCKCGRTFLYKTNLEEEFFTHNCISCGNPVNMKLNTRETAYVTMK